MSNITQKLIDRDARARQEVRRGTILTKPKLLNYDAAQTDRTVFVVDVLLKGASQPLRNVIVKSATGRGGRGFADQGKAVEIARNAGGRWIVIGSADRIEGTSKVILLDEETNSTSVAPDEGFSFGTRVFSFYADNLAWGIRGFANQVILDAQGNEVP